MGYGLTSGQGAQPVRPRTPIAPRPDNRAGAFGASPAFPSLASPARPRPAAHDPITAQLAPDAVMGNAGQGGQFGTPQAPQAPQAPPPINPAPVTPVAPNVSYDYNADPILAQTKALSGRNRGDAQSGALAARKQLAIDYNDTALADQLGDPATAQAAAQNPFGVLEQLKRSYGQGAHNLDENLNNQNLFYGSYRTQQQGNLAHDYLGQQAAAAGQEQGLLGGIGDQLTAALNAADAADITGTQDAANRAAAAAAANGVDPGAAGGTGPAVDPVAAALSGTTPAPAADALAGGGAPIDYTLASSLFPTVNTDLVNPAAFGHAASALAAPSVPDQPDLAAMLFPTASTPLLDPSAFAPPAGDPVAQALAALTPQQRRQLQFAGA